MHAPPDDVRLAPGTGPLRAAVVTGGLGSLGLAVADALTARGVVPLLLDRRPRPPDLGLPQGALVAQVDVADGPATDQALYDLLSTVKLPSLRLAAAPRDVDLVAAFHCAGGGHLGEQSSVDPALPALSDMHDAVSSNLFSAFSLVAATVPLLRRTRGSVVLTSSVNAFGGWGSPAYSASKAALLGYARSLATLLAPDGVRVNCVTPGSVDTQGFRDLLDAQGRPEVLDRLADLAPLGRVATADEVALAMVTVAFDLPSMTGQELVLDNGQTLRRF